MCCVRRSVSELVVSKQSVPSREGIPTVEGELNRFHFFRVSLLKRRV